jgi:hypothetical protein
MSKSEPVRVIINKDCDVWTAQCLEYDVCVQADDLDDLRARLDVALRLEAELHDGDLAKIGPAPAHFHDQWERRSGEYTPTAANSPPAESYQMAMYG